MNQLTYAVAISSLLYAQVALAGDFSMSSEQFLQGQKLANSQVFNGFGCTGENISPAIYWSGAPENTKSFAITLYDPDAPTGSGFWHWTVINIPKTTTYLGSNAGSTDGKHLPMGALQVRNDYSFYGFGGACPPEGDNPHHYELTLYALDIEKIDIPADASPAIAGFMIHQHSIASTQITAHYGR